MKRQILILIFSFVAISFIALEACKKKNENLTTPIEFVAPPGWPQPAYNFQNNPLTQQGIELGRKLFYDGILSKDGGYPCAGCHQQIGAFGTFDHDRSHGYNNSHTLRNAPPLTNLAWQSYYKWDGSANTLEKVILDHISARDEMGETVENVVSKLNAEASYKPMFNAAFGSETATAERLSKAISQFVLTMVSSNSKYDKVKRGEANFTTAEQTGYDLYKSKCTGCHQEPLFTDLNFRNIGMPVDINLADIGRMKVTGNAIDSLKFKVPSLRNVERTFPYGHDGRFFGLDNVLEHYRSEVVNGPTTDPLIKNKIPMSNFEFGQLKAFMYTLTDTSFISAKQFAAP